MDTQEWQLIETAPKDLQEVLVGWYDDMANPPEWCWDVACWQVKEGEIVDVDDDSFEFKATSHGWLPPQYGLEPEREMFPTHWMSLPQPPKKD